MQYQKIVLTPILKRNIFFLNVISIIYIYLCSPTLSQISLKNVFGKVVFQILAKIEMTQNKNRLFGRHFEMVQHFNFFPELLFFIVHTYGANFIAKFRWGEWFS